MGGLSGFVTRSLVHLPLRNYGRGGTYQQTASRIVKYTFLEFTYILSDYLKSNFIDEKDQPFHFTKGSVAPFKTPLTFMEN